MSVAGDNGICVSGVSADLGAKRAEAIGASVPLSTAWIWFWASARI